MRNITLTYLATMRNITLTYLATMRNITLTYLAAMRNINLVYFGTMKHVNLAYLPTMGNKKVKLSLRLTKHYGIKTYVRVDGKYITVTYLANMRNKIQKF
jgi:hypothetical protein